MKNIETVDRYWRNEAIPPHEKTPTMKLQLLVMKGRDTGWPFLQDRSVPCLALYMCKGPSSTATQTWQDVVEVAFIISIRLDAMRFWSLACVSILQVETHVRGEASTKLHAFFIERLREASVRIVPSRRGKREFFRRYRQGEHVSKLAHKALEKCGMADTVLLSQLQDIPRFLHCHTWCVERGTLDTTRCMEIMIIESNLTDCTLNQLESEKLPDSVPGWNDP